MDRRLATYWKTDNAIAWPRSILEEFAEERTSRSSFVFIAGTERDRQFLRCVQAKKIPHARSEIIQCKGKDVFRYPFFYLSVQPDREYQKNPYMDESSKCPGDERTQCQTGLRQRQKIVIDPAKSKNLDIMYDGWWLKPNIIIVSRKMRDVLVEYRATGCEFYPCLDKRKGFTEEDLPLRAHLAPLAETSSRFQLVIRSRVINPPCVGILEKISMKCSVCGAVQLYKSTEGPYFFRGDLNDTDFQATDEVRSLDGQRITMTPDRAIVSNRVLRLMIENGVKGLRRYVTEPDIPYGVVDIRPDA